MTEIEFHFVRSDAARCTTGVLEPLVCDAETKSGCG